MTDLINYKNSSLYSNSEVAQPAQITPSSGIQTESLNPIQLKINNLKSQISDFSGNEAKLKEEIYQLQQDLVFKQPTDCEQPNPEATPYYHETVKEIDEATTSLQKSIGGPPSGLSMETFDIEEKAITHLEKLKLSATQLETPSFSELVPAEIDHIGWQLEDWQKAIQNRDLHTIACTELE
nr:hypothetical protein [Chlamydiota bacterium]